MATGTESPRRKSIRLQGFDYSLAGANFVTICTNAKQCILSSVVGNSVELSPSGEIVRAAWNSLPERFPRVVLDEFVIMPNHIHAVLGLVGEGLAPPAVTTGIPATDKATGVPKPSVKASLNSSYRT